MYASLDLLFKTVVKRYYQQNAGFFLFIFVVFFGVLPPGQELTFHYRLISGMLETPVFFANLLIPTGNGLFISRSIDRSSPKRLSECL
jgi:hypothetical protein